MKKLTFIFNASSAESDQTPTAIAAIDLAENQLENIFQLREIVHEKNLTSVELFVHGVQWMQPTPRMESGEVVVSRNKGVALKAYPLDGGGKPVNSTWLDWAALETLLDLEVNNPQQQPGKVTHSTAHCRESLHDIHVV